MTADPSSDGLDPSSDGLDPSSDGFLAEALARAKLEPFRVDVHRTHETARVAPMGELDLATAPPLDLRLRELHEAGCHRFILDLRGLTFIASTGISLLIKWDTYARDNGIEFAVTDGPPEIQRVLELTGAAEHLRMSSRT